MLWQVVGNMLPTAIGVALSPVPIIAVILMLATPRGRTNGLAFAAGWVVGLTGVTLVVLLSASGASDPDSATSDAVSWVKVAMGLLFVALAVGQWRKRPRHGETATLPKWMDAVDRFTATRSGGLGVVLSAINPKNLALSIAAAATIAQADLSTGDTAIAATVFVVIASVSVAGPVLFYVLSPGTAAKPLDTMKQFMSDHNAVIMIVLFVVLGAKLLGDGIAGLAA